MSKPVVQSLWIGDKLTNLEKMCINSFLLHGYDFHLYTYGPVQGVPEGTTIKEGTDILPASEIFCYAANTTQVKDPSTYKTSPSAFSNLFRFTLIYKLGGVWVDTDIICHKFYDFTKDPYTFISECDKKYKELKFGASIIAGRKGDPVMLDAINICQKRKQLILEGKIPWGLGPATVKAIIEKYSLQKYLKEWNFANSCNCHHVETIMNSGYIPKEGGKYYRSLTDAPPVSHFIHLWNEFWRRNNFNKNGTYPPSTLYEQCKALYLPKKEQPETIEFTEVEPREVESTEVEVKPEIVKPVEMEVEPRKVEVKPEIVKPVEMKPEIVKPVEMEVESRKVEVEQNSSPTSSIESETKKTPKKKWKVCFTMKPVVSAYGGGNQFLRNLVAYLESRDKFEVTYELEDDIDLIFVMDPRKLKYNLITMDHVRAFKKTHPHVKVIHRVNDCDKPRDNVDVLDPIMLESFKLDNLTVFVSEWTRDYYIKKGFAQHSAAINNGCNQKFFNPSKQQKPPLSEKVRLVTHHWSDNWNKGFEFYEKLDKYIDTHPEFEFTFIGRRFNSNFKPKNIKLIGPFHSKELGDNIKINHIYFTASKFENCPIPVIEGFSCGLPVVYHRNLGGGVEVCERNGGEGYSTFEELVDKLNKIRENYGDYLKKINYKDLSSEHCCHSYYQVMKDLMCNKVRKYSFETYLKKKQEQKDKRSTSPVQKHIDPEVNHPIIQIIVPPIQNKILLSDSDPNWIKNVVYWMQAIENNGYRWSVLGYDNAKLSAVSLFAKLAVIYQKYYQASTETIRAMIMKYMKSDGLYVDLEHEIVSESRQAISGLINLGCTVPQFSVNQFYSEPLYFMSDKEWENPWKAGAHLSHYLFFMKQLNKQDKIDQVLQQLKRYEHPNGWYYGNPKPKWLINGIMKVFTGFDIINKPVDCKMAINIIDYLLKNKDSRGGCGIYDYIYVVTKCLEVVPEYRYEECKSHLMELSITILDHQQKDGGFKYDNTTEKSGAYYGQTITPNGMLGTIHGTVLFSMALARLDKHFNIGMNLTLPIS